MLDELVTGQIAMELGCEVTLVTDAMAPSRPHAVAPRRTEAAKGCEK